jgi:hypothetical protein
VAERKNLSIFVSIPAWRDPMVYETIMSAHSQALNPDSITYGVLLQVLDGDEWMIEKIASLSEIVNLKLKVVHGRDASPFLCEIKRDIVDSFMTDEKYWMQIDAHTKFRKNWDIMLKAEHLIANRTFGKSIINSQTIYFLGWEDPLWADPLTAYANLEEWQSIKDVIRSPAVTPLNGRVHAKPNNLMIKEKFYNGNCVFTDAYYAKTVQHPMEMAQPFEQQIMLLRTWTAGYEVVSPIHMYTNNFDYWDDDHRNNKDLHRHVRWETEELEGIYLDVVKESYRKFKEVFESGHIGYELPWGAFKQRSISEFIDFLGYNPITLEIKNDDRVCLENAAYISDKVFVDAIKEIAFNEGIDLPSDIYRDIINAQRCEYRGSLV